jgi:hypothetical protein
MDKDFTTGSLKDSGDRTSAQFSVNFDKLPKSQAHVSTPLDVVYGLSSYSLELCLKYSNTEKTITEFPLEVYLR